MARAVAAAALVLLGAGGAHIAVAQVAEGAKPPAVAVVGGLPISAADLEGSLRLRPQREAGQPADGIRQRLDELVVTEVLYQEGLRLAVDREPDVAQTIRQLVVQRLLEVQVDRPVLSRPVGDDEVKRFYEAHLADYRRPAQARAADIYFAAPEGGDAATREARRREAEAVLAEALTLPDPRFGFAELLVKRSDAPTGRTKGDTGFVGPEGGMAVPRQLAEAMLALARPGAITPRVVVAPEGFYVAMLTGRRDALERKLEDPAVRAEVEERLRTAELRARREEYVAGLRQKAAVSVDEAALGDLVSKVAPAPVQKNTGTAAPAAGGIQAPPAVPEAGR